MTVNIGFSGFALFVVFLVLKLTSVIGWSWLYVAMPLWIVPACVVAVLLIWLVISLLRVVIAAVCD